MRLDQINEIMAKYDNRLAEIDVEVKCCDGNCARAAVRLAHIRWMCQQVIMMIKQQEPDTDKINRWVGFIQGVLYTDGIYSINDMRSDNHAHSNTVIAPQPESEDDG